MGRNKITSLVDSDGVVMTNPNNIKHAIVEYYKDLLGTTSHDWQHSMMNIIRRGAYGE